MNNSIDQQFVEYVVKSLVGKPEAVQIERRIDEKGVLLELTVDPEDLGRVIGKRGATAQSLRTLLRALGTKNDARYNLKIVDNGTGGSYNDDAADDSSRSTSTSSTSVSKPQDDDLDEDDTSVSAYDTKESDVVAKTRKELEDLDDLDV
jgi:predicted RNA-binding protein YlqC (UPF0109 family)